MPEADLGAWDEAARHELAAWIGERPESVLAVHALVTGTGRAWLEGEPDAPQAVVVESALVPGEPAGFGRADALLACLERAEGWSCLEVDLATAASLRPGFARRWGVRREVTDVVHVLDRDPPGLDHPLVRQLTAADVDQLGVAGPGLLPDRDLCRAAAAAGRLHAAVDGATIVGHGSCFAAGSRYADVSVAVHPDHRRRQLATAAAARTCRQLLSDGLTPVWGTGLHNTASLRTAARLGFREVTRCTYLVRDPDGPTGDERR